MRSLKLNLILHGICLFAISILCQSYGQEWNPPVVKPLAVVESPEKAHQARISLIRFCQKSSLLITADIYEGKAWSVPSGKFINSFKIQGGPLQYSSFNKDQTLIAIEGVRAEVFEIVTGKRLWTRESPTGIVDVDFHPMNDEILISDDTSMKVFSGRTGRFLRSLNRDVAQNQWRMLVHFISDTEFATVSQKGVVMIWDYAKGIPIRTIAKDFLPDLVMDSGYHKTAKQIYITIGGWRPAYRVFVPSGAVSRLSNPPSSSLSLCWHGLNASSAAFFYPYYYESSLSVADESWDLGKGDFSAVDFSDDDSLVAVADTFSWRIFDNPHSASRSAATGGAKR